MSFFTKAKHRYLPVPEDRCIEAKSFLDACSEIVPFFDVLGSTAFAPVKSDINGNIGKLRTRLDSNNPCLTLQDIVNKEIEAKTTKAKNSATDALLWLKRALAFIRVFLEEVLKQEKTDEDLCKCVNKAYEGSLKKYHGWMVKQIFNIAMMAVPYRKDFIKALANDCTEDVVLSEMKDVLDALAANLDVINQFYVDTKQEKEEKV